MSLTFAAPTDDAIPLTLVAKESLAKVKETLPDSHAAWLDASGYSAGLGAVLVLPGKDGKIDGALVGLGDAKARARMRFGTAKARAALPEGTYRLVTDLTGHALDEVALGWLLAGNTFEKYTKHPAPKAELIAPDGVDAARLQAIAAGEALTRDLINTPASDMGPADLADAARALADEFGAEIDVIVGDDLIEQNFPMIHAVGRAAARAPRLIDMHWGESGPTLTLVGKGVCFDTGGLNLKPGASMGLMKKDMGGAATVLGLARMIMALGLKLQLRVLIPAVENAVSGDAFRPGDILTSRKGLTVEINNTDAEGRLVLADALALGDEDMPDLMVSMATLTGAARVAVGPDLAPFYATDEMDADALRVAAPKVADPVWEMPFWTPYDAMIEPGIADLDNAPKGGFAGSITAALFLKRFVTDTDRYVHFDIFGWQPSAAPARPVGGVGQGARALLEALPGMLKL
ncbi:leucyl aminopeptidase [Maritimibacter alkaliphilus HTCC2654]|uniref:Cytosol aminopeptidase family protein n=1 Tax=Maritimibacter alkaliphilus HTCC2654 TaxID=314271 RepID=A3VBP2_9RHOB|nr:leucyl aminopeptidase family protein [Maritimibacter alkaliphilus]EAQ14375.1 cytosol aminopeptidase family protein [Rhodobacterales bacterium HTCC2654] [Maritimibacter alkaliphilus HTCC2654]TYP82534.1 leucyl aminopeptidase [Maritimibacter alkaliphilus HTCC2654]